MWHCSLICTPHRAAVEGMSANCDCSNQIMEARKQCQAQAQSQCQQQETQAQEDPSTAVALKPQPHTKDPNEIVVLMWDNTWGNPFYWGDGQARDILSPPPFSVSFHSDLSFSLSLFFHSKQVIEKPNYAGFQIVKPKCPVSCTFTRDRTKVTIADALLFDVCWYGTDSEWLER